MNNQRRSLIQKSIDDLEEILANLEIYRDDEEFYIDSIPENLQYGERAERARESLENIEQALDQIEEAIKYLQNAVEN